MMATLLREHAEAALRGEPAAFAAIRQARSRLDGAFTKQVVKHPTREAAEQAWKAGDFATVRGLTAPHPGRPHAPRKAQVGVRRGPMMPRPFTARSARRRPC